MKLSLAAMVFLALGSVSAQTPRLDRYGDPLPAGALALQEQV
jgi:hypothetical protein